MAKNGYAHCREFYDGSKRVYIRVGYNKLFIELDKDRCVHWDEDTRSALEANNDAVSGDIVMACVNKILAYEPCNPMRIWVYRKALEMLQELTV